MANLRGTDSENRADSEDQNKVDFRYDDELREGSTWEHKYVIYTYRGQEYKVEVDHVRYIARIYGLPYAVQQEIFFWAQMLHNPD